MVKKNYKIIPRNADQLIKLEKTLGLRKGQKFVWSSPGGFPAHLVQKSHRHGLFLMNPWAGRVWASMLWKVLRSNELPAPTHFLTLLHPDWEEWRVQYAPVYTIEHVFGKMRSDVAGAFGATSYFFQLDFSFHREPISRNEWHCPHLHGLIWDEKEARRAVNGWPSAHSGAPGAKFKPINDLKGVLSYISKDTRCRYVTIPKLNKPGNRHASEPLSKTRLKMMLDFSVTASKPEAALVNGIGAELLERATRVAQAKGWERSETKLELPH